MPSRARALVNAVELFNEAAAAATSPSQIDEFLRFLPATPRYTWVRVYLAFHQGDLASYLAAPARPVAELEVVNRQAGAFRLARTYGRERVRETHGVFAVLPSTVEQVHRIVTVSRARFWDQGLRWFVRRSYPRIVPIFFSQEDLHEALQTFEHSLGTGWRLIVQELSIKEHREDTGPRRTLTSYDTDRKWTKRTVRDAFDQALEREQWFTSIAFRIERLDARSSRFIPVARCRLYKYGHLHFDGLYAQFVDGLLPTLYGLARQRIELFAHRGLRERGYRPAKPLELIYPTDMFQDQITLQRFSTVFMKYPNATKAVLHSNPYFNASVADFIDGSSFELWVLSPRRILIVPQAKSSIAALGRLTSYIFTEFAEGRVGEYSGQG